MLCFGCASAPPRPLSEFEDIPIPKGLVYQPAKSFIFEAPSAKAARLVYRGRIKPETLSVAMRTMLEANGWQHLSTSTEPGRGTVQIYVKDGNSVEVNIQEGLWFTYVALGASRGFPAAPLAMTTIAPIAPEPSDGKATAHVAEAPPGGGIATAETVKPDEVVSSELSKPRTAWESIKTESVSLGRSIKNFFTGLLSD